MPVIDKIVDRNMDVVIRCFTAAGRELCDAMLSRGMKPAAFMDVSEALAGRVYKGVPIVRPRDIDGYRDCLFFVANARFPSVRDELLARGIPEENILIGALETFGDVQAVNTRLRGKFDSEENWRTMCAEWGKARVAKSLPAYITVETSVDCNLNCVMCYYHDKENLASRVANSPGLYDSRSFDYLLDTARIVAPQVGGEPLLDPLFWELLERTSAIRPDAFVRFNTNGTLLTGKNSGRLAACLNRAEVTVSVDAATERTHRRIRGFSLESLKRNIGFLVEAKRAAGKKDLAIIAGMTVMRENLEEMDAFVEMASDLGVDAARVWPLNAKTGDEKSWYVERDGFPFFYLQQELSHYPGLVRAMTEKARARADALGVDFQLYTPLLRFETPHDVAYPMERNAFLEAVKNLPLSPSPESANGEGARALCVAPWTSVIIHKNGEIKPCCLLPAVVGNMYAQPFEEIWNNAAMQNIRQGIIDGRLHASCVASGCQFAAQPDLTDVEELPLGRSVNFDGFNADSGRYLRTAGLSHPESMGAWFCDGTAEISYKPARRARHRIRISLEPFIVEGVCERQGFSMRAGDSLVQATAASREPIRYGMDVSPSAIDERGWVKVVFSFPDCVQPVSLGLGRDMRRLSFRVSDFLLEGDF